MLELLRFKRKLSCMPLKASDSFSTCRGAYAITLIMCSMHQLTMMSRVVNDNAQITFQRKPIIRIDRLYYKIDHIL